MGKSAFICQLLSSKYNIQQGNHIFILYFISILTNVVYLKYPSAIRNSLHPKQNDLVACWSHLTYKLYKSINFIDEMKLKIGWYWGIQCPNFSIQSVPISLTSATKFKWTQGNTDTRNSIIVFRKNKVHSSDFEKIIY